MTVYAVIEKTWSRELVEFATPAEFKAYVSANEARDGGASPWVSIRRVPASEAHAWVRSGKTHMTGLWIDNGKVRYAKPDPHGY